jgi:hypothetical protein
VRGERGAAPLGPTGHRRRRGRVGRRPSGQSRRPGTAGGGYAERGRNASEGSRGHPGATRRRVRGERGAPPLGPTGRRRRCGRVGWRPGSQSRRLGTVAGGYAGRGNNQKSFRGHGQAVVVCQACAVRLTRRGDPFRSWTDARTPGLPRTGCYRWHSGTRAAAGAARTAPQRSRTKHRIARELHPPGY